MRALRLGLLATTVLVGACSTPCGFDSAEGGLSVIIKDAATREGRLSPGAYVFTVTTELGAVTWSCAVDEQHPDGEACDKFETVGSDEEAEPRQVVVMTAYVVEGEFRLELTLLSSGLTTGPAELAVKVERDGEIVADEAYAPKYVLSRAGGDGCGQSYVVDKAPTVELVAM